MNDFISSKILYAGDLHTSKTYYIGDFIIRLTDAGVLKVTSDRGVINIQPKADNAVEIKSSKS